MTGQMTPGWLISISSVRVRLTEFKTDLFALTVNVFLNGEVYVYSAGGSGTL